MEQTYTNEASMPTGHSWRRRLLDFFLREHGGFPDGWFDKPALGFADRCTVHQCIGLSFRDRLRVLLTGRMEVVTRFDTEHESGRHGEARTWITTGR